ncbi:phospholipid/glycerol acyltransferase [Kribbella flavida DSM 17836]|uniref:Phospholipid/glycerol acyltransferase n=1 Tax=Kribbella flavida (strain DSM 17836 / JCM 10339 / NBRC 14399) TaxID=479435 RepID=D2PX03_KRIFD|nr:lysophospholipid acyltransferase family protein [Kribbella flavida]ADB35383.1 phospholipid/glycerol acyltransferase [Kribbella flavida DSM 17836]
MADADIIPIGSGGRPGRGSARRTTPSAAARSLAGKGRRTDDAADAQRPPTANPEPTNASTERLSAVEDAASEQSAGGQSDAQAQPTMIGGSGPEQPISVGAKASEQAVAAGAADFAGFEQLVRDLFGADGERKVAELLAFVRRRLTGQYEVDEFGYDPELTDQVVLSILRPLAEKWFRVEVRGVENIPDTGGALIVANHSGTMPLDGLVTQLIVADHAHRPLRTLAADLVFRTPFVGELARKSGATLAGNDDAERLLGQGNLVGVWPEGFKGIGKPFSERYKLQRFGRGGFVSAAMRTGVPIVPCSIVGAEEIYPLVGNIASLARLLGVPYIPVTPFFPLLGPLGLIPLPSKWLIEFGEPIRTDDFPEGAADDPMLVFNVTDQVRETIQQTLYSLLMQRRSVFF